MRVVSLLGFIGIHLLAFTGNAQSTLCHSSFSCTEASQSNVVINPVPPGAWSQLYNTGGFTWEAWFRLKAPVINRSIIVSVEDAVYAQDIFLGFGWGSIPNALCFYISDNGTNNTVVIAESPQTYTLNTWYHVAGVCDYANATLRLYLNGTLVATQALPANLLANRLYQEHSAFIGNASASANGSDIDIDEVRFWNTARTTTEIQNNRTQCLILPQTGLVAWFKADETGAPVAKSAVNANFTATLQNAAYGPPAPVADCYTIGIGDNLSSCKTIDFTGTVTPGITILDWSWDFGDGYTANTQNTAHTYANFSSQHVTLTLKDNAGCGTTATTDVVITPSYVNDAKSVSICQGENFMGHTTSDVFTITAPAPDGCDTIRTYTLTVKNKPDLGTDKSVNVCDGSSVSLIPLYDVTGYTNVKWSTPDPDHVVAGKDTLFVSYAGGCSDTAVVTIVGQPKPQLGSDLNLSVCPGIKINLNSLYNTNPYASASWDVPTPSSVGAGTYTLIVTNNNGCRDTAMVFIKENPTVNTVIDTSLCNGGSIEGYTQPGSYTDVFHSANGCDSIRILNISACDIFFPNAFTPNGDGKNDHFKALNAINLKDFHLVIYNRWGQLVFETRDPNQGWDGFVNGKAGATGTYVWYCEYSKRGSTRPGKLKGAILLIR
jgi:gliding motility-associated-like protein